jgi:hypothetical protein
MSSTRPLQDLNIEIETLRLHNDQRGAHGIL